MKKKEFMQSNGKAAAFLLPFMFNFIILGMVPLALGILVSFFKFDLYDLSSLEFVGFENYAMIFKDNVFASQFWQGMRITAIFTLAVVPLKIIIPLGLAFLLSFKPFGYKVFQAILYFPTVISVSIVGVLFVGIFSDSSLSLFNATFGTEITWLSNNTLRWVVIVMANIWSGTGGNTLILLSAINNVPKSLGEACEADGGNWWMRFRTVILPGIKGSIEIVLFTSIINSFNLYGLPLVINHPINKYDVVSPMILIQSWLSDLNKARLTGLITAG
ncbi:MAG: sugar ABC transporter permease, partial [Clostridia bacterium]|nr:sugar ABC transporter permease [Clostridia bacterium]